ncbi:MAG: Uncharacterised protein [Owenweeksia sp. TMED14]|nr:MAG: Uncharacterised protein [Owenweeksia sp. TMED14]
MPKYVISPLIYEGHYEYILRINLKSHARGQLDESVKQIFSRGQFYVLYEYEKKDFALEQVEAERNRLVSMYQELGFRGGKSRRFTIK